MSDTLIPTSSFRYLRTATGTRLQYAWPYSERDQWIDVPTVDEGPVKPDAASVQPRTFAPHEVGLLATTDGGFIVKNDPRLAQWAQSALAQQLPSLIPGLEHARGIANHWWQRFSMLNGTLEARGAGQVLDEIDAELRRLRGEGKP